LKQLKEALQIKQKKVRYEPVEKVWHGFINILSGNGAMVQINQGLRTDRALQLAFGCGSGCAEQSVVQDTLDACQAENVSQLAGVVKAIYQQRSRGYQHNYQQQYQILDVDLMGRTCGKQAEGAQKGYFKQGRNRRGRQVGRVVASHYEELVSQQLYNGQSSLTAVLLELVEDAADVLDLDAAKRARTIIRFDAGGGSVEAINSLLTAGYQIHGKDYSAPRIKKVTRAITAWSTDPQDANRQFAWLPQETTLYPQPIYRLAVRSRRKAKWGIGLLLSSLSPQTVLLLLGWSPTTDPDQLALAYLTFYDQRAGTIELSFKQGAQALATRQRNKRRFVAQQMLLLLETLAHNLILWLRDKLKPLSPSLAKFGLQRWVRDLFHISGLLSFDHSGQLFAIVLNQADPIAQKLGPPLAPLLAPNIVLILGEI
jgi:hypothetical protein